MPASPTKRRVYACLHDVFFVNLATNAAIAPGSRAGAGISYPQRGQRTLWQPPAPNKAQLPHDCALSSTEKRWPHISQVVCKSFMIDDFVFQTDKRLDFPRP